MLRADDAGFTLIEVLVALVVTALLLAVILQGASLATARLRATAERRQAQIDGRYLLVRAATADFSGATRSGTTNGLVWTSQESLAQTDQRRLVGLVRLHVLVQDRRGATLFDQSALRLKALPQR